MNTLLAGAIKEGARLTGVIAESRAGREAILAKSFVDCTAFGDLAAYAGASYTEPNDYPVVNSMSVGGVNVERFHDYLESQGAVTQLARPAQRQGRPDCPRAEQLEGITQGVPGRGEDHARDGHHDRA